MSTDPHFLGLTGARRLRTSYWLLGRRAILDCSRMRGIASVTGPPGTGKSFLLATVAPEIEGRVVRIEFDHRPTMLSTTTQSLMKLTGEPGRGSKHDKIPQLIEALSQPTTLLVDEAQRLNRECLDHLRYLHDHPDTNFGLVLAGGEGCWEVLGSEPQLRRRIYRPVFFRPLSLEEIITFLPRFHPIWRSATPDVIERLNSAFGYGLLGHWAAITKTLIDSFGPRAQLDDDVEATVLILLGAPSH